MENEQAQNVALRERVKELTCLYSLAQLGERSGISVAEILQGTVALLPPAWQYPEITAGRIVFDEQSYVTVNFHEGGQVQSAPIVVNGKPRGRIDVVYVKEAPRLYEGPFLKEERSLIDTVARQLALIIERRQAEEDRLRLQDQLRHADRLATIGQLAAGVAHELNEPLGNILGFAQLAQKQPGLPAGVVQDLAKIVATCLHARQIINSLMLFSRQMPPQKTRLDLNVVVEEAMGLLELRCAKIGITMVRHLSGDLPAITADAPQLRQAFVNLVVNAIHAMPGGGVLEVATRASGDRVVLTVQDNGIGMSYEHLNGHDMLRDDPLMAVLADKRPDLDELLTLAAAPGSWARARSQALGPRPAMHWSSRMTLRGPPSSPCDQSCGAATASSLVRTPSVRARS